MAWASRRPVTVLARRARTSPAMVLSDDSIAAGASSWAGGMWSSVSPSGWPQALSPAMKQLSAICRASAGGKAVRTLVPKEEGRGAPSGGSRGHRGAGSASSMLSVANVTRLVRAAVEFGLAVGGGDGAAVGITAIEKAGLVTPGMVLRAASATARAWGASPSHDDPYLEPWGENGGEGAAGPSSSSRNRLRSSYASSSPAWTIAWRLCPGKVILDRRRAW